MGAHLKGPEVATGLPDRQLTAHGYVLGEAALHGNRTALIDASSGQRISYHTLVSNVRRLASGLYRRFERHIADTSRRSNEDNGAPWGRQDTDDVRRPLVCIYAANCLQYPQVVHAVLLAGGAVTTVDSQLTTDQLTEHFELLLPDFVVADYDKVDDAHFAASRVGPIKEIFVLGRHLRGHVSIEELLRDDGRAPFDDVSLDCESDITIIPFDVSSRGELVGVMHTHRTFNTSVCILGDPSITPVSRDDVIVCCHQMATMVALVLYCGVFLRGGATCVILPTVTNRAMLEAISKFKATAVHVTTSGAEFLANDAKVARAPINALKRVHCSGAPLREGVIGDVMVRCGVGEVREGLSTSGSPAILCVPRGETLPGYVGQVCPHTEVQVRDILFNGVVELETFGELCVRGPQVTLGQIRKTQPNKNVLENGWLHTGHIGQVDNTGNFSLFGNIDTLIGYSDFQISPIELERIVRQLPDVSDAVVVGMDNHGAGHVPRAYVMKKAGVQLVEAEVRDYVADQVVDHKRLRGGVVFVNDVPRTTTGEPHRHKLQAEANKSHFLDISLGEDAQWPPDAAYIEDMKILQQEAGSFEVWRSSTTGTDSLNFSIGQPQRGISEVFTHPEIMFENNLDGFITTRQKPKVLPESIDKIIPLEDDSIGCEHVEASVDSMNKTNITKSLEFPAILDNNNNKDIEDVTPRFEIKVGEGSWIPSDMPVLADLSVDCPSPIGTSTPKHSPRSRPAKTHHIRSFESSMTSFNMLNQNETTAEDKCSLNQIPPQKTPQSAICNPKPIVPIIKKNPEPLSVCKPTVKSDSFETAASRRTTEKTRQRKPTLDEAMNPNGTYIKTKSRSPSPTTNRRNKPQPNVKAMGGYAWKSTGELTNRFSQATSSLETTAEKSTPNKSDSKFKAAENIRLRAMEYSQQVRRREQEKRSIRNYGRETHVSPILHKGSSPASLHKSKSTLADHYNLSLNYSGSLSPLRGFTAFSLTKRFDNM